MSHKLKATMLLQKNVVSLTLTWRCNDILASCEGHFNIEDTPFATLKSKFELPMKMKKIT